MKRSHSRVALVLALFGQAAVGRAVALQSAAESAVELRTPAAVIYGTLTVPAVAGKMPLVLIIAGSGPTDRNGNSPALPGANNAYKMLAESLAAEGVASLRYDKRGIAASRLTDGTTEAGLRFDMYVDDAAAWLEQLRHDDRFSRLIVAGHSEGSLIGMLAAAKARADAFVSIAGPARRASEVLRDQLRPQISMLPPLWTSADSVITSLEAGTLVDPLPAPIQTVPGLASLFRPSVQPYIVSWFKYVPATAIAALAMPVLIVQGTTDIQVGVDEARALKAAKPDADLLIVDGMNHVMKQAPADRLQNAATYGNPSLPIVPDVPSRIAALAKNAGRR